MVGAGLIVFGAVVIAGLVVGALFLHSGRHRAALVACALPLVLLLPTLAVSFAGFGLIRAFSGMAVTGGGGELAVTSTCRGLWGIVRVAAGAVAALSFVSLLLGLVPMKAAPAADRPPGSALRKALLLLLPLCALLLVGGLVSQVRSALRMTLLVVTTPKDDAQRKATYDQMAAEGITNVETSAGIAETSNFIAWRASVAGMGGIALLVVLTGLSLTGLLLAAPVRTEMAFAGAASVVWLAVALLATVVAVGRLAP
jgi:hypothetical protein